MREISQCVDTEKQDECDCEKARQLIEISETVALVAETLISIFLPWSRLVGLFWKAKKVLRLAAPELNVLTKAEYENILIANRQAELTIEELGKLKFQLNTAKAELYRAAK
jgi:hypothetical protein